MKAELQKKMEEVIMDSIPQMKKLGIEEYSIEKSSEFEGDKRAVKLIIQLT